MKELVKYIKVKNGKISWSSEFMKQHLEYCEEQAEKLSLDNKSEYIYYLFTDKFKVESTCAECGSKKKFGSFKNPYRLYCSTKCANKKMIEETKNKISNSLSKIMSNMTKEDFKNRTITHQNTIKNQSYEYKEEKRKRKSESVKEVHKNRTDEEKEELNKTISEAVKNSEKAKLQRKDRSALGQKALQEKLSSYTEDELEDHYNNQQSQREKTFLEKYNVLNPMQIQEVKERNHKGMRETNIRKGNWFNKEESDLFKQYTRRVWSFTNQNDLESLDDFEKRGHINNLDTYHLDHIYSIFQGFKDNIPTFIIGNIVNLQMLPARENITKNKRCYITKEKLLKEFYE